MKTIKLLFFSLLFSTILLTSCTNDDVNNVPVLQESESMQTALNHLRTLYNDDGTVNGDMNPSGNLIFDFCFEFVYPINLIYNTGSIITINSNEELIQVLINSTSQLYIVGIEFPFDVEIFNSETNEIETITITNENEFIELLINCEFGSSCECDNEYDPVCIEIEENGQVILITFINECEALCEGFTEEYFVDCENNNDCDISELEIEIGECNNDGTYNLTINFEYENTNGQEYFDLYLRNDELLGYFSLSDLPLTIENFPLSGYEYDYLKVCINDNIECCEDIEWMAPECDTSGNDCDISNLQVEVGDCNSDDTYSITIDFDYENVNEQEFFDLYVRNDELLGYFTLSELPITIDNFNFSGYEYDYIKVCINDNPNCCEELEWLPPECGTADCYEYGFPISMYFNGTTVSVNSNEQVDYYLELDYELVYPIELIINNEIILVYQGILEGAYGDRCD